jgi:hypothetical protein
MWWLDKKIWKEIKEYHDLLFEEEADKSIRSYLKKSYFSQFHSIHQDKFITSPGNSYTLYSKVLEKPAYVTGYIDLSSFSKSDEFNIKIMLGVREGKTAPYFDVTVNGPEFVRIEEILVPKEIEITVAQNTGKSEELDYIILRR